MSKQTAYTHHGEVEYETVTCASCENEVAKDAAIEYVVGDRIGRKDWSTLGKLEYEFRSERVAEGYICNYCADIGPMSTPKMSMKTKIRSIGAHIPIDNFIFLWLVLLAGITMIVFLLSPI